MWTGLGIAAAGIGGAVLGSKAAGDASQTQADATQKGIDETKRQYDDSKAALAPYRAAGQAALTRLQSLLGVGGVRSMDDIADELRGGHTFDIRGPNGETYGTAHEPELMAEAARRYAAQPGLNGSSTGDSPLLRKFTTADMNADPVYNSGLQFGLDEGRKALERRAAASGGYDSGAEEKALTRFGNDYGTTKAEGAYGRFVGNQGDIYGRLSGIAGMGAGATNVGVNAGSTTASNLSNLYTGQGNASAAASIAGSNAATSGLNNISQYMMLSKLSGGGQRTTTPSVVGGGYQGAE